MNSQIAIDRFVAKIIPTAVLKEYYCRILRKLSERGVLENDTSVRTSDGFLMNVNKTDGVSWRIYFTGYHDRNIGELIKLRLEPGDVFVDVGANIGYFSIMAGIKVGPAGRVVAFEASPSTTTLLRKNIQLNDLTNIYGTQCRH